MNALRNSERYFRALTGLLWLTLPAAATLYAVSWNQLPARLATHFNLQNHPNGWMSREGSLFLSLAIATLLLATATGILSRVRRPDPAAWGVLAVSYVSLATLLWVTDSLIAYNVEGRRPNIVPVLSVALGSTAALVCLALLSRRGAGLSRTRVFADETHRSPVWALVLGMPAVLLAALALRVPLPGVRVALGLGIALMLAGAAMAGSGFHYEFSPVGVEIRTLGFRMRSIAAHDIQSYSADRWNALGGYGIRGVGDRRAYVWGNTGVRIKTAEGEVFLGHDQPERVVSDLDRIVRNREMHGKGSDLSS